MKTIDEKEAIGSRVVFIVLLISSTSSLAVTQLVKTLPAIWSQIGLGLTLFWVVYRILWHSCNRYELAKREVIEKENELGTHRKEMPITLKAEFVDAAQIDPDLMFRVFRVKITNLHKTKTASDVELCIDKLTCPKWMDYLTIPFEIKRLNTPHPLPATPSSYKHGQNPAYNDDIHANSSKLFDLAYTRVANGGTVVGLAPFRSKPAHSGSNYPNLVIWDSEKGEIETDIIPTEQSSFFFEVSASGKDIPRVPIRAVLRFPWKKEDGPRPWITQL